MWIAIAILASSMVAAAAALADWIDRSKAAHALLVSGGAFGATMVLIMTVLQFIDRRPK